MNYNEFAEKIKNKYPQYNDLDNKELAQKMVAKYPQEYSDVTFDDIPIQNIQMTEDASFQQPLQGGVEKTVNLTPSGIIKNVAGNIAAGITAPINAMKNKTSVTNAFKQNKEYLNNEDFQKYTNHPVQDFATDMIVYSALPELKAIQGIKGAGLINKSLTGAYQGGIIGGLESLKHKGISQENLSDTLGLAAFGAVLPPILNGGAKITTKILKNPSFQNKFTTALEGLTSVPKKYLDLALNKELAGKSIFNGKFDTETAYRPIEQKLKEAKSYLPDSESYAERFYSVGQKAKRGLEKIKTKAGDDIKEALENLSHEEINIGDLKAGIQDLINNYSNGGEINPAIIRSNREINEIYNLLSKDNIKPIDLHNIKEILYDIANYDAAGGIKNTTTKAMANKINDYLRKIDSNYAKANDKFALIKNVEYDLGGANGINSNTIGGKLSQYGTKKNIENGLDRRLKNVDMLLEPTDRFLNDTKTLVTGKKNIDEINRLVGSAAYERNPRLLSNFNDISREEALDNLQKYSGINFMDDLEAIRAREALERFTPGQGGGSGSSQGYQNLLRSGITTTTGGAIGGLLGGPMGTLGGLITGAATVSPKIMGKGSIKNLGAIYKALNKEVPKWIYPIILQNNADLTN